MEIILPSRYGASRRQLVFERQYEIPEVRKRLLHFHKQYRPDLIVVDGRGLVQELRSTGLKHIHSTKGGGKVADAEIVAPMIEGGRLFYLPEAPGLAELRNELIAFPKGKYTDQVDSMVQLLKMDVDELAHAVRVVYGGAALMVRVRRRHGSTSTTS